MLLNILTFITSNLNFFTTSIQTSFFPKQLPKEEETYINKMLQGDKEAINKLIEHNLRLVAHIFKNFESSTN